MKNFGMSPTHVLDFVEKYPRLLTELIFQIGHEVVDFLIETTVEH